MTKITYVSFEGVQRELDVPDGLSVMEGARRNGVEGIDADCGGACACATCKVLIEPAWFGVVGPPGDDEQAMLDFRGDVPERTRLACQIKVRPELEGLVVRTPLNQDTAEFCES